MKATQTAAKVAAAEKDIEDFWEDATPEEEIPGKSELWKKPGGVQKPNGRKIKIRYGE